MYIYIYKPTFCFALYLVNVIYYSTFQTHLLS